MSNLKLLQLARANAARTTPLRAESEGDEATIYLHGVIGGFWGEIDETEFAKQLAAIDASMIHLRINSPGGDVFAARAMMAAIAQHQARVVAHVDGLAASAATGICMACDEVEITQGGGFMIHNAWTIALGNKSDFRDTADLLEKIDTGLANDYVRRTGQPVATVQEWMDAETWFTADEALENKFVDRVVEVVEKRGTQAMAAWDLSAYTNAPAPAAADDPSAAAIAERAHAHAQMKFKLLEGRAASRFA